MTFSTDTTDMTGAETLAVIDRARSQGFRLPRIGDVRQALRAYIEAGRNRKEVVPGIVKLKSCGAIADDLGGLATQATVHGWLVQDHPDVLAAMRKQCQR